ncbi:MAG TPA: HAD family phosphatase [Pyrinomonadaceae bacterium]|nr:HAD family phosphatase [Pyrinomonadaceae bacterium]
MIQAIFFDFNGVIIDDEPLQMAAYKEVLRDYGIELTESDYYSALGLDDKGFVRATFARYEKQLTDEMLKTILDGKLIRHRKLIEHELPLFPGVVTFLKSAARHYSICLVSMASPAEIEHVLERANLQHLFSVVVSSADVNVCKPAPDCYQSALRKLNERRRTGGKSTLASTECLAIEDSPPGIEAGRLTGMHTLGITNTVSAEQLRAAGAEVVSASLADWTTATVRHVFQ